MFAPSFSLERINKKLEGKQKKTVVASNYKQLRKLGTRLIKKKLINEENSNLLKEELRRKKGNLAEKYTPEIQEAKKQALTSIDVMRYRLEQQYNKINDTIKAKQIAKAKEKESNEFDIN